ncbi:hypothetical protein APY08_09925 [Cutibacterium avidum]|nr:hypothetical protein APY07_09930 [Cutibacterium avidum]OIJ77139.1 hypothetical protein APY08_09925 [Cutibacterium avidum]OIJ79666.1 hypothetical protein APY06_09905 [Cutibacterium avidum]
MYLLIQRDLIHARKYICRLADPSDSIIYYLYFTRFANIYGEHHCHMMNRVVCGVNMIKYSYDGIWIHRLYFWWIRDLVSPVLYWLVASPTAQEVTFLDSVHYLHYI